MNNGYHQMLHTEMLYKLVRRVFNIKCSHLNLDSEYMSYFTLQNVKFEAEIKTHASHDPRGESTLKEIIIRVTNTKTKKVWHCIACLVSYS